MADLCSYQMILTQNYVFLGCPTTSTYYGKVQAYIRNEYNLVFLKQHTGDNSRYLTGESLAVFEHDAHGHHVVIYFTSRSNDDYEQVSISKVELLRMYD
mmetsp:Transcript_767/g.819  ORF Transcript_767/g.819 Transcript_767/m.819 type:complete len:99 (+) Transcript_767:651-947(+)